MKNHTIAILFCLFSASLLVATEKEKPDPSHILFHRAVTVFTKAFAQEVPEEAQGDASKFASYLEEGNKRIVERLYQLLDEPLNINGLSEADLEKNTEDRRIIIKLADNLKAQNVFLAEFQKSGAKDFKNYKDISSIRKLTKEMDQLLRTFPSSYSMVMEKETNKPNNKGSCRLSSRKSN